MGVQDRDWWREHYKEQRRREAQTGAHRLNVRGSSRPLTEPWFTRRSSAWAAIFISLVALAATSNLGRRVVADLLDLGRTAPTTPPLPTLAAVEANSSGLGPSPPAPDYEADVEPFPDSGSVVYSRLVEEPTSQLHLLTNVGDGRKFVVRLYDVTTNELVAAIYLKGGHQVTIRAPYGAFRLKIASGRKWLGETSLFGMSGEVEETDTPLMFYPLSSGGSVGQTVVLSDVLNGNLREHAIAGRNF